MSNEGEEENMKRMRMEQEQEYLSGGSGGGSGGGDGGGDVLDAFDANHPMCCFQKMNKNGYLRG